MSPENDTNALARAWSFQHEWAQRGDEDSLCILDLLARVEALEANAKPTPNPSQIRRSLVERVTRAIGQDDEPINWEPEARAAIREVAGWLKEHGYAGWLALQKEVERA
jgi:hypothetical protein